MWSNYIQCCFLCYVKILGCRVLSRFRFHFPIAHGLLFHSGSKLLIRELPSIFDGSASGRAEEQDDSRASLAPKVKLPPTVCPLFGAFLPSFKCNVQPNGDVGSLNIMAYLTFPVSAIARCPENVKISAILPGYMPQYCILSLRKVLCPDLHNKTFNFCMSFRYLETSRYYCIKCITWRWHHWPVVGR